MRLPWQREGASDWWFCLKFTLKLDKEPSDLAGAGMFGSALGVSSLSACTRAHARSEQGFLRKTHLFLFWGDATPSGESKYCRAASSLQHIRFFFFTLAFLNLHQKKVIIKIIISYSVKYLSQTDQPQVYSEIYFNSVHICVHNIGFLLILVQDPPF